MSTINEVLTLAQRMIIVKERLAEVLRKSKDPVLVNNADILQYEADLLKSLNRK